MNNKSEGQSVEINFDFLEDTIISGPTCLVMADKSPTKDAEVVSEVLSSN